jgi:hypothetical protein
MRPVTIGYDGRGFEWSREKLELLPPAVLDMIQIRNVSLVGTPGGLTVRVMCLTDLFPYLTAVSLVHHIYTYCKPHGRARGLIVFPAL